MFSTTVYLGLIVIQRPTLSVVLTSHYVLRMIYFVLKIRNISRFFVVTFLFKTRASERIKTLNF